MDSRRTEWQPGVLWRSGQTENMVEVVVVLVYFFFGGGMVRMEYTDI